MKPAIIIISILVLVLLLIRAVKKYKHKGESKLSVFEHPGTFKKPDIEMVNKVLDKEEKADKVYEIKIPDKTDRHKSEQP